MFKTLKAQRRDVESCRITEILEVKKIYCKSDPYGSVLPYIVLFKTQRALVSGFAQRNTLSEAKLSIEPRGVENPSVFILLKIKPHRVFFLNHNKNLNKKVCLLLG